MKFLIKTKQLPEIKINFEELKITLTDEIKRYAGLVVSKQTLKSSISSQKELAGLKRKIDTARKDIKRELLIPIKKFEDECKELYILVENAETPIKKQIEKFEIERKEEVEAQIVEDLIAEAKEQGISITVELIDIPKQLMNKTVKKREIESFVNGAILKIKNELEQKANELNAIKNHIFSINSLLLLKSPLKIDDFIYDINSLSYPEVIEKITGTGKRQQRIEKEVADKVIAEEKQRLENIRLKTEREEQNRLAKIKREEEKNNFIDGVKDDPILDLEESVIEDIEPEPETETGIIKEEIEIQKPVVKTKQLEVKLDKPKFVKLINFLSENDIEHKIK